MEIRTIDIQRLQCPALCVRFIKDFVAVGPWRDRRHFPFPLINSSRFPLIAWRNPFIYSRIWIWQRSKKKGWSRLNGRKHSTMVDFLSAPENTHHLFRQFSLRAKLSLARVLIEYPDCKQHDFSSQILFSFLPVIIIKLQNINVSLLSLIFNQLCN